MAEEPVIHVVFEQNAQDNETLENFHASPEPKALSPYQAQKMINAGVAYEAEAPQEEAPQQPKPQGSRPAQQAKPGQGPAPQQ